MSTRYTKTLLHCGIATIAMLAAAPAYAQDGSAEGSSTPTATNTGRGTDVENPADIIVTARRTEERLQDVPISITVFNNQQIVDKNIAVASDLPAYTPSLQVNTRFGPEKAAFAIRGFNQDASTGPTVGLYFADVISLRAQGGTTSGNTAASGSFTDLQNVQVLKGPQGTLFGRNTTGGAILLVPQRPTDNLGGYVEGTYGNFDQKRVQAALNIPLADTFKVRFSLDRNKRDGYMINHSGIGPKAYNDVDYWYGRISILAELTPDLENYTVAYYSHSRTNGYAARIAICNPALVTSTTPTLRATAGAACDQITRQAARGDSLTDVDVYQPDQTTGVKLDSYQIINTTTWKAADNLTIKNIASFGEFRENSGFNLNSDDFLLPASFGPLAGQRFQYINLDAQPGYDAASQSTTTEELQLQGSAFDNKLTYVLGGYLEFSRPISFNQQRTGIFGNCLDAGSLNCAAPLGFVSISQSRTRLSFDNHGLFAQATYNFTDKLALTLGFRETFDKTVGYSQSSRITLLPVAGVVRPVAQSCNDSFRHPTVNVLTQGLAACGTTLTQSIKKPTWLIDVDYKPNSDILLYAKWARGYRQGGINFTNPGFEVFGPEKVDLYELGAKTSFRGTVSGTFNVAAFYNNFRNQQVFGQLVSGTPLVAGGNAIINAGKSVLKGVEADASLSFFRDFRVDAGYTFLDTKLKSIPGAATVGDGSALGTQLIGTPFVRIIPIGDTGGPLTFAPKHRITLTGTYTLPLDENYGRVSLSATYLYSAHQFAASLTASPIGRLPATNLVNLNLNWNNVLQSGFDVAGFATNVTNKKYPVAIGQGYNSAGFDSYLVGVPRVYGVRLRYHFGR